MASLLGEITGGESDVHFKVLENKLRRSWIKDGKLKITNMPDDFYLVEFSSDADYNHALFEGPW